MNSKKQIIITGAIVIVIFSILFFNIRAEHSQSYNVTTSEINGINTITDIYKLDILLKSIRGLNQLNDEDAKSLKNSLFISDDNIITKIKNLFLNFVQETNKNYQLYLFFYYLNILIV